MKNISASHITLKQDLLSSLINADCHENTRYNNTKASLLNNATVFPLPDNFSLQAFSCELIAFFEKKLNIKSELESVGVDIFALPFSPIGLGLMKKAVVYSIIDSHLYINIVPVKEMENANYSENVISELFSSGKNDQIYNFVEEHVLSLYPSNIKKALDCIGRYFFKTSFGLPAILANHLEDNEFILAKLDIYKIEASKSNAQTSDADNAFYILTTNGSYLFVLDKNLQEKYIETLSADEMVVHAKIGRDTVDCGTTKWITHRDNDFLFDEIQKLNNKSREEKILSMAKLNFNFAEKNSEKARAAQLMEIYAQEQNSLFSTFASKLLRFSSLIDDSNAISQSAKELLESANSLFSENEFEKKLKDFLNDYKFSAKEIVSLIFVISRAKNRINDTATFRETLLILKDKFFKMDSDSSNRAFVEICIARKLECVGEKIMAKKLYDSVLDKLTDQSTIRLLPVKDSSPEMPYASAALYYAAVEGRLRISDSDDDKAKYARLCAIEKPLIEKNLASVSKYQIEADTQTRIAKAMAIFDSEKFSSSAPVTDFEFNQKFTKLAIRNLDESLQKGKAFADLMPWLSKVMPDKNFSSIKNYAEKVTPDNFPQVNSLAEICRDFFDLPDAEVFVIFNRNQGLMSNDDGESKYILIDGESLDNTNPGYLSTPELMFQITKEFASLKMGISRLSSHPQWRNFNVYGVTSIDIITQFAPNSLFMENNAKNYSKLLRISELLTSNDLYFDFDIADTENAAYMLEQTIDAVSYKGVTKLESAKEKEYAALSMLTNILTDKIALLMTDDIVSAIKSIVHTDKMIKGGMEFCDSNCVAGLATCKSNDGKPINYDFAIRLSSLVGFYVSDNYKILRKNFQKNS